jgi:hypothetical protein
MFAEKMEGREMSLSGIQTSNKIGRNHNQSTESTCLLSTAHKNSYILNLNWVVVH